jgi:hypothetical protein
MMLKLPPPIWTAMYVLVAAAIAGCWAGPISLFAEHKRASDDSSLRLQRSDLIHTTAKNGDLIFRLIEVKYRSSVGGIGEDANLKDAIASKNDDTQMIFQTRFVPLRLNSQKPQFS